MVTPRPPASTATARSLRKGLPCRRWPGSPAGSRACGSRAVVERQAHDRHRLSAARPQVPIEAGAGDAVVLEERRVAVELGPEALAHDQIRWIAVQIRQPGDTRPFWASLGGGEVPSLGHALLQVLSQALWNASSPPASVVRTVTRCLSRGRSTTGVAIEGV